MNIKTTTGVHINYVVLYTRINPIITILALHFTWHPEHCLVNVISYQYSSTVNSSSYSRATLDIFPLPFAGTH